MTAIHTLRMICRTTICLILCLIGMAATACSCRADLTSDMNEMMSQVRSHDIIRSEFMKGVPQQEVLQAMLPYLQDESLGVRLEVLRFATSTAASAEIDITTRRWATEIALKGMVNEPRAGARSNVREQLIMLPPSMFSPAAQRFIEQLIEAENLSPDDLLLAGAARLDIVKVRQVIQQQLERAAAKSGKPQQVEKTARWALAALGDASALNELIRDVTSASDDTMRLNAFSRLANTRRPQAVATLAQYVMRDETLPSVGLPGSPGAKVAGYALYHLRKITTGLPSDVKLSDEQDIQNARAWLRQHSVSALKMRN